MRMILLYYKCTFALFIFRLHKLGIEAHAYAHYTSLLYFALLCFALVATVFVHFHKNKFKFLYKHKTAWLLSSRYSVSLRARHSVGSRGKALTNTIQNTIHSLVNSHMSMPGGQFSYFWDKTSLARDTRHRGSIPGWSRPFRDGWHA